MNPTSELKQLERQARVLTQNIAELRRRLGKTGPASGAGSLPKENHRLAGYLAVAPTLGADALLQNVLHCVMRVVHAGGAGLTLFDPRTKRLVFRAAVGDGAEGIVGREVPLKGSQHGLAFATGEVQAATPLYRKMDGATRSQFRNVLVAPMVVAGEAIGTLSAVNKQKAEHFATDDLAAIKLFADQAAVVVRQRCREQILRDEFTAPGPADRNLPVSISGGDRELLKLFDALASVKEHHPGVFRAICRFTEEMVG